MRAILSLVAIFGLCTVAVAQGVPEQEPNDTFGTAQVMPADFFGGYGAGAVEAYLGAGDVDFFAVRLPADVLFTASVFDYTPWDDYDNDSYMGIFDPSGALYDTNDDALGYLSSYSFIVPQAGLWAVAVTGYGDTGFTGNHGEEFDYRLVMSIPEPASLGLLLVGLGAFARRR